jgi:hypothetical protein
LKVTERMPCEFFLIRYVPDPVKGEFANIGVLLREAGREDSGVVRFTRDWSRVTCLDGDADIGLLEGLEAEIDSRLRGGPRNSKPVVSVIGETFSNSIQMTEARACLAENMMTELELLMRLYVEPLRVKQTRKRTGRAAIAGAMRTQFERAGVWALMRKRISASLYTLPGDPMKIDCGYRPNGVVKMFHAVSLDGDVEAAKVLAYSAPRLREGVTRVEAARLELTAVVEPLREVPEEDEGVERYRFGVEAMESQNIRVVTMNDLARAAETARLDLRL